MQTAPVPMPDPNLILVQVVPIFGMLTAVVVSGFVLLGPVGRSIGRVIQHWLGGGRETSLPAAELDDLHHQVQGMRTQLAELAERQDFTERMLAQVRKERALPGPQDGTG